jgi:hypothetical protein
MTGQQLRDILSRFRGLPAGQKTSPGAGTKQGLINLIICLENQNN